MKTPLLESLFNKVAALKACNFIKKRFQQRCFRMNSARFLRLLALAFFYEWFASFFNIIQNIKIGLNGVKAVKKFFVCYAASLLNYQVYWIIQALKGHMTGKKHKQRRKPQSIIFEPVKKASTASTNFSSVLGLSTSSATQLTTDYSVVSLDKIQNKGRD